MFYPWHVIRIRPGFERQALPALAQFDGFSPMHRESRSKRVLPLMTGYVFARWETTDAYAWHEVKDAKYVSGFIGTYWPDEVTDPIIDLWYGSKDEDGVVPLEGMTVDILRGFKAGDLVKFTYGPFVEQVGICVWVDRTGARVNTGLLGRESSVWVPVVLINRASDLVSSDTKRGFQRRRSHRDRPRQARMVGAS